MRRTLGTLLTVVAIFATACSSNASSSDAADVGTAKLPPVSKAPTKAHVTIYASPSCGCCHEYIPYLVANGYEVETVSVEDTEAVKLEHGIPEAVWSCHTAIVDGYFVEGHVPFEAIDELLDEKPRIDGIALPGMPAGSPGMNGTKAGPFEVVAVDGQDISPFMSV